MKRAITLAGGGPAAGLHIGALKRLEEANITFRCLGAVLYRCMGRNCL